MGNHAVYAVNLNSLHCTTCTTTTACTLTVNSRGSLCTFTTHFTLHSAQRSVTHGHSFQRAPSVSVSFCRTRGGRFGSPITKMAKRPSAATLKERRRAASSQRPIRPIPVEKRRSRSEARSQNDDNVSSNGSLDEFVVSMQDVQKLVALLETGCGCRCRCKGQSKPTSPKASIPPKIPKYASEKSEPTAAKKLFRIAGKFHLLIACTGSVASIKLPDMITEIRRHCGQPSSNVEIRVMATKNAMRFFDVEAVAGLNDGIPVFTDEDEWTIWKQRGDPVLHIELRKWADMMLIAPLNANTLAKIANGMCDNLVTCVVRAWDPKKPLYFAPAMNTYMWNNSITVEQVKTLRGLGYKQIPCIEKGLMCGDKGYGAMAELPMIGSVVAGEVKNHFASLSSWLVGKAFECIAIAALTVIILKITRS